jgi:hypothetical protein
VRVAARRARALAVLLLLATAFVSAGAVATGAELPRSSQTPGVARVETPDSRVTATECALLGRRYTAGRGCERSVCVSGARPERGASDAEVCRLRGRDGGPFATAVDVNLCRALNRRWIEEVNWCASNPDRADRILAKAAACRAPFTTLVTQREEDGFFDECLRPSYVEYLRGVAKRRGTSVNTEAANRSPVLCADRPHSVYRNGVCVTGDDVDPAGGGDVLIGDSIAWRSGDELHAMRADLVRDGSPGRRFYDLRERLDRYAGLHGTPDGVILELGTNAARRFERTDFEDVVGSLPQATVVMLVLPYRTVSAESNVVAGFTTTYAQWMQSVAASRPLTCVADWRSTVRKHPRLLVDGVHPTHANERYWARWVVRQWDRCRASSR